MFWYVAARCAAVHGAHSGIFRSRTYIRVMAFIRIKIIRKNGKTYRIPPASAALRGAMEGEDIGV